MNPNMNQNTFNIFKWNGIFSVNIQTFYLILSFRIMKSRLWYLQYMIIWSHTALGHKMHSEILEQLLLSEMCSDVNECTSAVGRTSSSGFSGNAWPGCPGSRSLVVTDHECPKSVSPSEWKPCPVCTHTQMHNECLHKIFTFSLQ